jgi:hypothetical protein
VVAAYWARRTARLGQAQGVGRGVVNAVVVVVVIRAVFAYGSYNGFAIAVCSLVGIQDPD